MIQTSEIEWTMGFPAGSAGKESACNVGDLGSIPGLERSPGERNVYPLQYSGLENSMNFIVYGVTQTWLSVFYFHFIKTAARMHLELYLTSFICIHLGSTSTFLHLYVYQTPEKKIKTFNLLGVKLVF